MTGFSSSDAPVDCDGSGPLLKGRWSEVSLRFPIAPLGEWQLPANPGEGALTEIRMALRLVKKHEKPASRWYAEIRMEPSDASTVGLAFNFQKAALEWETEKGPDSAIIDWTSSCTTSGVSFFPVPHAQSFWIELPSLDTDPKLRSLRFRIWGRRS